MRHFSSHTFLKHFTAIMVSTKSSLPPPPKHGKWGGQVGGRGVGNLQTDAAQLFLFVPIPTKAKKLGLLSIYKCSLSRMIKSRQSLILFTYEKMHAV
jgi:hypothetical protein